MILGAILAGGQSTRFGADKALADYRGRPLIAHVAERLLEQVGTVLIAGRAWGAFPSVADHPAPGLGPLGGLCAALRYARDHGYRDVLVTSCDTPILPADLAVRLRPSPSHVSGLPVIGMWPAALADRLEAHLLEGAHRSMRAWIAATGARAVPVHPAIPNINRPGDLARLVSGMMGV